MAYSGKKNGGAGGRHCGEGSPALPKQPVRNVQGGDKVQQATKRVGKSKDMR